MDHSLTKAIHRFIDTCENKLEEEGGVILKKNGEYRFIKLANTLKGTQTAIALYKVDPIEYGKLVIPLFGEGWRLYASAHIHPSFSTQYSGIDYHNLFQGFKINFIYSHRFNELSEYEWTEDKELTLKQRTNGYITK